jgi:CBS domain-containing protein
MRAPLAGAVFAAELTGDFHAFPALLATTGAAYAVTVLVLKRSILTEKIARRGHHITREYSVDPFELLRVRDVMVREVDTLPAEMGVKEAVAVFTGEGPRHKSYPVIDRERRLVGMVARADALRWMTEGAPAGETLFDAASDPSITVGYAEESVGRLADRLVAADVGRAPVIDEKGRLVGLIARKDILRVRALSGALETDRGAFYRLR